jgi:hypothetical protein
MDQQQSARASAFATHGQEGRDEMPESFPGL